MCIKNEFFLDGILNKISCGQSVMENKPPELKSYIVPVTANIRVLLNCRLQTAEPAEPPEPVESAGPIFFSKKKRRSDFLKHLTIR